MNALLDFLGDGSRSIERLLFDSHDDPLYKLFRNFDKLPLDKFGYFYKVWASIISLDKEIYEKIERK